MATRVGTISVETENIFPIIQKWLYSEHDIFLRELVANGTDAITKRAIYARTKNMEIPEGQVDVTVYRKDKKITITDNGIGMTEEEVERYIAQIAFSGASEFIEKMKSAANKDDIIGKFGLGFFSSFMVSNLVEIDTLSVKEGAQPVHWSCDGTTQYTFSDSMRKEVGTTITLHIKEESAEFLDSYKVTEILRKFCDFMPHTITVYDADYRQDEIDANAKKKEEKEKSNFWQKGTTVNETYPLWKKEPNSITDEEYKKFYAALYPMEPTPLFWLHLKVDHPFTLEGILYFPKLNMHRPIHESNIKLYCRQVFVSDNCKSIIPDFMALLKGVIDSPDIPLNVSRSSLQGDPNIKKISNYVAKKIAEALKKLAKNDRAKFEAIWPDIGLFVKYGIISDAKFDTEMRDQVIFKNVDDQFLTFAQYRDQIPAEFKDKLKDKYLYLETGKADAQIKKQLLDSKIPCLMADDYIDPHFMQHLERASDDKQKYSFVAASTEFENLFAAAETSPDDIKVKELFEKILLPKKEASADTKKDAPQDPAANLLDIEVAKIKNMAAPAYYKVDEQIKRYQQMAASMGHGENFPLKKTLVINPRNAIIQNALKLSEKGGQEALVEKLCHYVQDLAAISSEGLKEAEKDNFVLRGQELIEELSSNILK